jgi:hypothetical protein
MMKLQHLAKKLELKRQKKIEAGQVSDKFPEVSNIIVRMIYNRKKLNPLSFIRTVNFSPESYAYFHFDCLLKDWRDSEIDLTSLIGSLIRKHKRAGSETVHLNGSEDLQAKANVSIDCKINIQYKGRGVSIS